MTRIFHLLNRLRRLRANVRLSPANYARASAHCCRVRRRCIARPIGYRNAAFLKKKRKERKTVSLPRNSSRDKFRSNLVRGREQLHELRPVISSFSAGASSLTDEATFGSGARRSLRNLAIAVCISARNRSQSLLRRSIRLTCGGGLNRQHVHGSVHASGRDDVVNGFQEWFSHSPDPRTRTLSLYRCWPYRGSICGYRATPTDVSPIGNLCRIIMPVHRL